MARLILSQFKWLYFKKADKIADKLVEIAKQCTAETQKLVISFIPEIVDDTQHAVRTNNIQEVVNIS